MQIQYVDDQRSDYRPGACNIGPAEIARRRQSGLLAIAVAVGVAVAMVVIDAPPAWRLLVFPFLAAGFNTLEQARRRFCVGFAMAGIRDLGPAGERTVVSGRDDAALTGTSTRSDRGRVRPAAGCATGTSTDACAASNGPERQWARRTVPPRSTPPRRIGRVRPNAMASRWSRTL